MYTMPPPLHYTDLAQPLQADVEAGLATPGAVQDMVVEPLHHLRVILSLAVQTAGRLRLLCPHPEVTPLLALEVVEGGALLVPQREVWLGAGREDTGAPGLGSSITALALQTHPASRL